VRQVENASNAIRNAIEVVCEAAPNARDYYLQDDNAFAQADREHVARLKVLEMLLDDYAQLHVAIVNARGR
jgi:hypothetical protein